MSDYTRPITVCVYGTTGWYRKHTPLVQNYAAKHRPNISEQLRVISVKYSSILPNDGSHTIRNTSE